LADTAPGGEVSVAQAALTCRCPRCGQGKLFDGLLEIRPACSVCGLSFDGFDTGDGFAVPILIVLGAIVVGAAFWVDFRFHPPLWVHAILWLPVTCVLVVLMTRYIKSFLAAQQYRVRRSEMQS
jgi:uncharacterized protein (DUF983 family)